MGKQLTKLDTVDSSRFGDPLASKIDWSPLRWWGGTWDTAEFCGYTFVELGKDRLAFRGSFTKKSLLVTTSLLVLAIAIGGYTLGVVEGLLLGLLLVLILATTRGRTAFTSFVFDRETKSYWRGSETINLRPTALDTQKRNTGNIYAPQLVAEWHNGFDYPDFHTFQLNLILNDGTRQNVTNINNQKVLCEDADRLGAFLGVPVWDAT